MKGMLKTTIEMLVFATMSKCNGKRVAQEKSNRQNRISARVRVKGVIEFCRDKNGNRQENFSEWRIIDGPNRQKTSSLKKWQKVKRQTNNQMV